MDRNLSFNEIVELFLSYTIYDIKDDEEPDTVNINFIFGEDGYKLFDSLANDGQFRLHHATQSDIDFLNNHLNDGVLSLEIKDANSFFQLLTDLVNVTLRLTARYNDKYIPREGARMLFKYIWFRMGVEDVKDVEAFLRKQLEFAINTTLDMYDPVNYGSFDKYTIRMKTKSCDFFDESTRKMIYTIEGDGQSYELPHILYDIDNSGVCYLYAVQSSKDEDKSKHIERKLYQFIKGVEKPNVHPSKISSLFLFIHQLKRNGIHKIIVPGMQVLSYDYHQVLPESTKRELETEENILKYEPDNTFHQDRYKNIKNFLDRIDKKQDKISYLKTQQLYRLVEILTEQDPSIQIMNDVMMQGDYMDVRL